MNGTPTNRVESLGAMRQDIVLHWYDFLCPFCYVAQHRNAILRGRGLEVVELPFQAHPDIPVGGVRAGPRTGGMYAMLDREAKEVGLPLRWPPRLPNTRTALAAAEWARRSAAESFPEFHRRLFAAHFEHGEDLEDSGVIDAHAKACGIDIDAMHSALHDGSAEKAVDASELLGRHFGVQGTPAWLIRDRLFVGLRPVEDFERIAAEARQAESSTSRRP